MNESTESRCVLIFDDDVEFAIGLMRILRRRGYETHCVFDGQSAFEFAEQRRPYVMIVDVNLTEADVPGVIQRIRQEPWGREILIVSVSDWREESIAWRKHDVSAYAHFANQMALFEKLLHDLGAPPSAAAGAG